MPEIIVDVGRIQFGNCSNEKPNYIKTNHEN